MPIVEQVGVEYDVDRDRNSADVSTGGLQRGDLIIIAKTEHDKILQHSDNSMTIVDLENVQSLLF
jgi:hypothetical protein